ncbi:diguanylate cyclase [Cellulomonas sp. URHE0023]|uniref:GGDEF domain-containing protein n=1 Tax=Cellulomonas sp. URHE0023 TaxID=1380354 RepID=UPI000A5D7E9F|nr:GGDEF domain-containing protein [Cellulomonas sp. URHE0023]
MLLADAEPYQASPNPNSSPRPPAVLALPVAEATSRPAVSRELVLVSEFGPLHHLAVVAHQSYIDGFSIRTVARCRQWVCVTDAIGDRATSLYLLYGQACALLELGEHRAAVETAQDLLARLGDEPAPVWRAKALGAVAEGSNHLGEHSVSIATMAEADWLLQDIPTDTYGHLSASMAVAIAMRSAHLVEQAEAAFAAITQDHDAELLIYVAQEQAVLSAHWATALLTQGRPDEAAAHLVRTASRATLVRRLARQTAQPSMEARADVIEAYALLHLGESELAFSRARAAAERFSARPELLETHLLHLVLARAHGAEKNYAAATELLHALLEATSSTSREVWAAAARAELADVMLAEHGPHPAMDLWRQTARAALGRAWAERDARYSALRDRHDLRRLASETDRAGRAAGQDPLTQLANRSVLPAAFASAPDGAWAVFIDVDNFKAINDNLSHSVGDLVLQTIAEILRAASRSSDVVARYGGDEFVILPSDGAVAAQAVARRVNEFVRRRAWGELAPGLAVTVSVGVGPLVAGDHPLHVADLALLAAKDAGRDQIVVADV